MLTPVCRNEIIDCVKANVWITVLPIIDVKTRLNSTLEWFKYTYQLGEFTNEWLKNPKYSDYQPL
jgi:hypothetical protein